MYQQRQYWLGPNMSEQHRYWLGIAVLLGVWVLFIALLGGLAVWV